MAHEIETAFFYKNAAWHGLGNVVQEKPKTTREAMVLAGMDWMVEKRPIQYVNEDGSTVDVPGQYANVRISDGSPLGIVGETYDPLQNIEAFQFFDRFVENGSMYLDAAGSLRDGRRVFILSRPDGMSADVIPGDRVDQHLLLWTSHDGTMATGVMWTPIRVVCANTLRAATANDKTKNAFRIPHTGNQRQTIKIVEEAINVGKQSFDLSIDVFRAMQKKAFDVRQMEDYVRAMFDRPLSLGDDGEFINPKPPKAYEGILEAWEYGHGSDIPGVKGTVWGAFNAATAFIDHHHGRQKSDESDAKFRNRRLDKSWFGSGQKLRQRAFDAAVALV